MRSTGGYVNTILGQYSVADGDFRLGSVRAGTRTFPDAKKVPMLVKFFCEDLNKSLDNAKMLKQQCETAFQAHFDFVSIHPFGDGNGRTSRLIMNYVQSYFNLPLSVVFKQDRIAYINALEFEKAKYDEVDTDKLPDSSDKIENITRQQANGAAVQSRYFFHTIGFYFKTGNQ